MSDHNPLDIIKVLVVVLMDVIGTPLNHVNLYTCASFFFLIFFARWYANHNKTYTYLKVYIV